MLRLLMAVSCLFSQRVYEAVLPRPRVRTVEWADGRVAAPPPVKGSLRFDLFPYMREPLDCLDDPEVEVVALQFGSRLGKTTGVQAWLLNKVRHDPHNAIWGEPDDGSLRRVFRRTWAMIDGTPELAEAALPRHLRSNAELRFQDCLIHGAYSGSPATAADLAAPLGAVLNECDKYSHRRRLDADGADAGEADFADLLIERTKGCPGAKVIFISTPTVKGRSRIEAELLRGDRRRFYVPCPHCNGFQVLKTGRSKDEAGGIKWTGKTPEEARDSAWYECEACRKKILDEHRYAMINAGRWVKQGQSIDRRGRVTGKPLVASNRRATFGPLGTHYSLLFDVTWGRIAEKFLSAIRDPLGKGLRNFENSWEGITHDPAPIKILPSEVEERLRVEDPLRVMPAWASFVTLAADVGRAGDELVLWYAACAWGVHQRGQIVDLGVCYSRAEFLEYVRGCGAAGLRFVRVGVDCGHSADLVYELVKQIPNGWAVRGASQQMLDMYSLGFQQVDVDPRILKLKRKRGAGDILYVNTERTQEWVDGLITGLVKPGDKATFGVPADAFLEEPDLVDHLLAEFPHEEVDRHGRRRTVWTRTGANEYRDVLRYNLGLAWHATKNGVLWPRLRPAKPAGEPNPQPAKARAPQRPGRFIEREGGWLAGMRD